MTLSNDQSATDQGEHPEIDEERRATRLEDEWNKTADVAVHFNDLLMRLRTLGLPIVIAVIGAGVAYGLKASLPPGPRWVVAVAVLVVAIAQWAFACWALHKEDWASLLAPTSSLERWAWYLFGIVGAVSAAIASAWWSIRGELTETMSVTFAAVVILLGLALLSGLYWLDRFYYYKLLLAAVSRAQQLEDSSEYGLMTTITAQVPRGQAASLITGLYWLIGFVGQLAALVLVFVGVRVT